MAESGKMMYGNNVNDKKTDSFTLPVYAFFILLIISSAVHLPTAVAEPPRDHRSDNTESPNTESTVDLISEERSFIGWLNDSAIFNSESYFSNDSTSVSYQFCSPECCRCDFDFTTESFVGIRDDLPQGTTIYPPQTDRQQFFCRMIVDADSQFMNHIAVTLLNLDVSSTLPSTPAALRVYLNTTVDTTAEEKIIWHEKFSLGPYHAENGIAFQLPRLKTAILSEDRRVILLEIIMEGAIERMVVKMPRRTRRNR